MATYFCMGIDLEVKWNKTENLAGLLYYTECIFSLSKNFCMTDCLGVNWNTSASVKCHKKKRWLPRIPVSLSQNAWKHNSGWPAWIKKWRFGFIKLTFTYCSFCLWTGQKYSWEINWDEKHLLSPCSWFWPTLENWVSKIMSICIYIDHSQGGVLMDGKMGLAKDLVVFGQRFVLSEVILYHQYIICLRHTKAHQALLGNLSFTF